MKTSIPDLAQSKKFGAAALAAMLSFWGMHKGMSLEQVAIVTAPLYAYIGSQGLSDFGKSRAQVERNKRSDIPTG